MTTTPPWTFDPPAPPRPPDRPRNAWKFLVLLSPAIGFAAGLVVIFVSMFLPDPPHYERVDLPGTVEIDLDEGEVAGVYHEFNDPRPRSQRGGSSSRGITRGPTIERSLEARSLPPAPEVVVTAPSGAAVDLDLDDDTYYEEGQFDVGRSIATFEAPEPGTYRITGSAGTDDMVLAVGPDVEADLASGGRRFGLGIGVMFGVMIVCIIVGARLSRGRADPTGPS